MIARVGLVFCLVLVVSVSSICSAEPSGCSVIDNSRSSYSVANASISVGISFKIIGATATFQWGVRERIAEKDVSCKCSPCCPEGESTISIDATCTGYWSASELGTATWRWDILTGSADILATPPPPETPESCRWRESLRMGSFVEYVGIFDFSVSGSAVIGFEDSFDNQTMQLACSYSCFCSEDAPSPRSLAHPPRYLASESPTLMNLYEVAGFTTLWVDDGRDLRFVAYRTSYGLSIGDGASDIEYTGDGDSHTYRVVTPVVAKLGGEAYIQLEGIDQEGTETPSQNLNCYVNQAPELKLEEAGWEDVQYVVRFSIDDPDFVTTPERYRESVTLSIGAPQCDEPDWGVVGGEGWTSSYVSDTEGITLYVEPLGDGACRAECSLEVRATDANGFTDTLLISVPPALCAIDSSVSAKLGSVVDLTMGCTNPEAYPDSVLTYQLGEVDLDGIGRISGTPPDCTLSILATNCHDEVVIPYTIR